MACAHSFLILALANVASAGQASNFLQKQLGLGEKQSSGGLIKALEFQHRLRVCNAYPYEQGLDVFRGGSEKITQGGSMPYKTCEDFKASLKSGDKLDFKVGDASTGSFFVSDLPANDAILLLVVHRHDTQGTSVSFESHVFANLPSAQVAVIDTYRGADHASLRIKDIEKHGGVKNSKSESLRYNSVVAVNPGEYDIQLFSDGDGQKKASSKLVAVQDESYVVLRTGVRAKNGKSYPEELMIFPQPTPERMAELKHEEALIEHSSATTLRRSLAALLAVCVTAAIAL
jgi:hypothetical protein